MKALYLTKYSRKGASSRLRSFQYFPLLFADGVNITVKPFFDDIYLQKLYEGKKQSNLIILKYYISRLILLFSVRRYDVVVIEKELFPYFFSWFERLLNFLGVKYIVDYDDAIFHNYDLNKNRLIRFLFYNKISTVMKNSKCVVAGNSYLAKKAIQAHAEKVVVVPTVIDTNNYVEKTNYQTDKIIIGWIGSPSTFKYVKSLFPLFDELVEKYDCKIHFVGANDESGRLYKNIEYIKWTEETEIEIISKFDIGIMPLDNSPWELGKCAYKLIQYMGCGIPVVASPVGMNLEVVEHGINGYFACSPVEWREQLEKLILDSSLRASFGKEGRKKVEDKYSLVAKYSQMLCILKSF